MGGEARDHLFQAVTAGDFQKRVGEHEREHRLGDDAAGRDARLEASGSIRPAEEVSIKIFGPGGVVYDNQMGAGDDADPTAVIESGNIVIHR